MIKTPLKNQNKLPNEKTYIVLSTKPCKRKEMISEIIPTLNHLKLFFWKNFFSNRKIIEKNASVPRIPVSTSKLRYMLWT